MPKNNETTTKFKVDISELKKNITEANRQIRLANAEFKAAASGMDDWTKSTDGLSSKIGQLHTVLDNENKKLKSLKDQLALVEKEYGKNSAAADDMRIKVANQQAVVNKTTSELKKYENQLSDLIAEQQKASSETDDQRNAYEKLQDTIKDQESELKRLKSEYANAVLEQGKTSDSSKDLAKKIENLSQDLKKNKDALNDAEKASDDLDDSFVEVEKSTDKATGGFTVMKGAIAVLIADGLKALASTAIETMRTLVVETDAAYDNFQAKTGTSTEAMGEFEEQMQDLYKAGLGDSLGDIADAMAEIKQQTKETDPNKLKELTENALALRDTFGYDVRESMRAVNMLMEQFGIDGEEAYNLIVQGAQKGLDKNGDLLDTINEYGVHYHQLGYDADEFFNSLANGTDAGTFSVDKLGDAMKEFGIRTKDTANTTDEGFELVGLSAEEMRKEFAKGGDSAKKATKKTLKALLEMDDQVAQNQAGVDLFGTMWEDLGIEGVKALMNTEGELKKTNKSMKELKEIKYDNVKTSLEKVGRTLQTDLLLPLVEKIIPKVEKFTNYLINNSDTVVAKLKVIGATIATVFVVNKVATFINSITTMVTTFKSLKTATEGATAAQKLLNLAQNANPIGLVAAAVGGLTAAYMLLRDKGEDVRAKWAELSEEEKANKDNVDKLAKSYDELKSSTDKSVSDTQSQFTYYKSLTNELDTLVDKNGKVKTGYEERATFIVTTLNEALGSEIKMTDGIIENYQEQKEALDKLIETKRAQIILNANEAAYTEAISNQTAAFNNLSEAQANSKNNAEELKKAEEELEHIKNISLDTWIRENGLMGASANTIQNAYSKAVRDAHSKVEGLTDKQEKLNGTVEEAEDTWINYNSTIKNYEGLSSAIIAGDTDKINKALDNLVNGFITAEQGNKRTLEKQVSNMKTNYANLKKAVENGAPGVTQEMVDTAKEMVNKSVKELDKFEGMAEKEGEDGAKGAAKGIKNKEEDVKEAGKNAAKKGKEGLEEVNTESSGSNFIQGFIDSLKSNTLLNKLSKAVKGVGSSIMGWFNKSLGEQSPSKLTKKSGKYFLEGFGNGLDDNISKLGKTVTKIAGGIVDNFTETIENGSFTKILNDKLSPGVNAINQFKSQGVKSNLINASKGTVAGSSNTNENVTNVYNFNQTNNSPKSLSRLEIYRQTKNLVNYGMGANI